MGRKKEQSWGPGDVFTVALKDGTVTRGQVLERMMKNVASCAFYDLKTPAEDAEPSVAEQRLISLAATSIERLDRGDWHVLGSQPLGVDRSRWPNEGARASGWVGAKIFDAAIIEEFLNAYYGLCPWDDWHDPAFLDSLLVAPEKKPTKLVYKRHN